MAIIEGKTVTRGLVSKTASGINQAIAKAFEDNIGYDKDGSIQKEGGSSKQSTVAFKWRGTQLEAPQKFAIDLSEAASALKFTGNGNISKVATITLSGNAGNLGRTTLRVSLGGTTGTFQRPSGQRTAANTALYTELLLLSHGNFSQIVQGVSINGATLTIHYTQAAGNISFPSSISEYDDFGNAEITWTTTEKVITAHADASARAILSLGVETNNPITGTTKLTFPEVSPHVDIAVSDSLVAGDFNNLFVNLINSGSGVDTLASLGNSIYSVLLNSKRGVDSLVLKFSLVRDGVTTEHSVTATTVGANTSEYVPAEPETYGTLGIQLQDPSNEHHYNIEVGVPQNTPITEIEENIKSALSTTVIGVTEDGATRYASEFVKASISGVTSGIPQAQKTLEIDFTTLTNRIEIKDVSNAYSGGVSSDLVTEIWFRHHTDKHTFFQFRSFIGDDNASTLVESVANFVTNWNDNAVVALGSVNYVASVKAGNDTTLVLTPTAVIGNTGWTGNETKLEVGGTATFTFIDKTAVIGSTGTDAEDRASYLFTLTLDWVGPGSATKPVVNTDGLTDYGTDFATVTDVVTGSLPAASDRIPWDSVATSATLQPGGETTHYATLVYSKPVTA